MTTYRKIENVQSDSSSSDQEDHRTNKHPSSFNILMQKKFMVGDYEEEKFNFDSSSSYSLENEDEQDPQSQSQDDQASSQRFDNKSSILMRASQDHNGS